MAKTYKKISGSWYPIKKIYKRISGAWSEVKKLYKKVSGTWQVVHTGAYEYTFTTNASNVDFATLIGASAVADNTDFIITINSGVTVSGTDGVAGANNNSNTLATGSVGNRVCFSSYTGTPNIPVTMKYSANPANYTYYYKYYTGAGGTGGTGNFALDFSGMSGKTITIINNGILCGGNGAKGGMGSKNVRAYGLVSCGADNYACALGGTAGNGRAAINNGSNSVSVSGNTPTTGSNGSTGSYGYAFYDSGSCSS